MKKYIFLGGFFIAAVGSASLFFMQSTYHHDLSDQSASLHLATERTEKLFSVTPIHNQVLLKSTPEPTSDFTEITQETETGTGSRVKTSDTGRAIIEGGHTTVLDHGTEILLVYSEPNKTRVEIEAGNVWSRIEKTFDQGEFYEIETHNAVASVRGTSFGIFYANQTTFALVTEGAIALTAKDGKGGLLPGSTIIVSAGEKAAVSRDGVITLADITDKDKQSEWFLSNNPDEKHDDTPLPQPTNIKQPQRARPKILIPPSTSTNSQPTTPPPSSAISPAPNSTLSPGSVTSPNPPSTGEPTPEPASRVDPPPPSSGGSGIMQSSNLKPRSDTPADKETLTPSRVPLIKNPLNLFTPLP